MIPYRQSVDGHNIYGELLSEIEMWLKTSLEAHFQVLSYKYYFQAKKPSERNLKNREGLLIHYCGLINGALREDPGLDREQRATIFHI